MRYAAAAVMTALPFLIAPASLAQAEPAAPPTASQALGSGCPGMYGVATGRGMMGGGPWMMGHQGMMSGPGPAAGRAAGAAVNLTTDDVRRNLSDWLTRMGNSHIKVGRVTEAGSNAIAAEIITTDKGGLVQRYVVDRRTGQFRPD